MLERADTPELNKISEVQPDSQVIGQFLEWLDEQEIYLAEWTGSDCDECGDEHLMRMIRGKEKLMAQYFSIDLVKAEKERQAILDDIRADNEKKK